MVNMKHEQKDTTEYSVVEFDKSLRSSFIKEDHTANEQYAPHIVTNNKETGSNVLGLLKSELAHCTHFDFSVAFITSSGVQVLIELLKDLERRNIKGRILTSTYLNFNDPDALTKLIGYKNIDCRVYQGDLHAKGYFFDKNGISTIIIGSSNLTQKALTCNQEWNILFHTFGEGQILKETKRAFEYLWNAPDTVPVTLRWINDYREYRKTHTPTAPTGSKPSFVFERNLITAKDHESVIPNRMQRLALESLDVIHRHKEPRALLISATGTGKTYLSAFDVLNTQPTRVLYIAHRRSILEASLASFRRVLGNRYSYGIIQGGGTRPNSTCTFAMVQTIANHLDEFPYETFDYLIIDEAHRAGSLSYRRILDHFRPVFCLGMTATPTRTDGYDVYALFNHVIAYRITLQDALENEMLTPFHYFGIADLEIDDEAIDDVAYFGRLTSAERVRHIISKIREYTVDSSHIRGLIFCNRNDEATELSVMFNERGWRTEALSGNSNESERKAAIERLEKNELQYIFTVDIFNEGVDIPSVNQIIMLRRTESSVVFIQQLGRGLRKYPNKEYTLILDFIGNYQQNYLIPIALSDDRTYNKDNLRRVVKEGSTVIPGASTITFDSVSQKRIFSSLDQSQFSSAKLIQTEYFHLKKVVGHIPSLIEFDENNAIDPLIIFRKYGSYAAFLQRYEKDSVTNFDNKALNYLKFISQSLANGKRLLDLKVLNSLVKNGKWTPFRKPLSKGEATCTKSVAVTLSGKLSPKHPVLIEFDHDIAYLSTDFKKCLDDETYRKILLDTIDFGLARNKKYYSNLYKDTDFVLYSKYSYSDVCRLLRWSKEISGQNIGGYFHDKETNTFPVFINYDKDPSNTDSNIMYEDRFVSDNELIAISKNNRSLASNDIQCLQQAESNGIRCFLFVRKNKEDKDGSKEFYFLGEIHPTGYFKEVTRQPNNQKAVEISYRLDEPVRPDLFDFLTSDLNDEN